MPRSHQTLLICLVPTMKLLRTMLGHQFSLYYNRRCRPWCQNWPTVLSASHSGWTRAMILMHQCAQSPLMRAVPQDFSASKSNRLLLRTMMRNRCWVITFHSITTGDADHGVKTGRQCDQRLIQRVPGSRFSCISVPSCH